MSRVFSKRTTWRIEKINFITRDTNSIRHTQVRNVHNGSYINKRCYNRHFLRQEIMRKEHHPKRSTFIKKGCHGHFRQIWMRSILTNIQLSSALWWKKAVPFVILDKIINFCPHTVCAALLFLIYIWKITAD